MLSLTLILAGALVAPASEPGAAAKEAAPDDSLRIDRGAKRLPLLVPRDEELTLRVIIDAGLLGDLEAGKVVLSSGVDTYIPGLPVPGEPPSRKPPLETGWIRSFASGGYAGYDLRHELRVRLLPQDWPRVFYTDTQRGSESRRRELRIGLLDGRLVALYQHDGHCKGCSSLEHFVESAWMWGKPYHCEKCKRAEHRVGKEPVSRAVPEGAVDMLSAVYLARSLVREGLSETTFPLVDKQVLWNVFLKRGKSRRIDVPAGRFESVQVEIRTEVPAGEPRPKEGFEGMFGMRGSKDRPLGIWMEEKSGVPVRIDGEFPVPLIGDLEVRVELVSHRGTPPTFHAR